jgi:hypothetical protein
MKKLYKIKNVRKCRGVIKMTFKKLMKKINKMHWCERDSWEGVSGK